jgi:uncharacterized spore protein YtfJ
MTETAARTLDLLDRLRGSMGASTVVSEPITQDGLTLVPVVRIAGGGGGGGGAGAATDGGKGDGTGAGFGLSSRPVGAFVIKDGTVRWRPAVDVNRIVLGAQVVAVTALLTIRAIVRSRHGRPPARRPHLLPRR